MRINIMSEVFFIFDNDEIVDVVFLFDDGSKKI